MMFYHFPVMKITRRMIIVSVRTALILGFLPPTESDASSFYVISPKDIVIARPRDVDDHIQWLVEHEEYEEALKIAEMEESKAPSTAISCRVKNIVSIGQKWLSGLLAESRVSSLPIFLFA